MAPSRMTLHVLTPVPTRPARSFFSSVPRDNGMAKLRAFFDDLINISAEPNPAEGSSASTIHSRRPRIVYIRDFATLAESSATWYPALLAAVRQRRQGPISRPSSPVLNPTTIVFGITPPITGTSTTTSGSGPSSMMNLLMSQRSTSSTAAPGDRKPKIEYAEDTSSDKARERRTTSRMKRWARSGPQVQDIPQLASPEEMEEASSKGGKSDVVVLGGGAEGMLNLPSMLGGALMARGAGGRPGPSSPASESSTQFFRTSLVLPNVRTASLERETRMARRREINELTTRMGVAAVGGELEPLERPSEPAESLEPALESTGESTSPSEESVERRLWDDWAKHIVPWQTVRRIADRAVGRIVAERTQHGPSVPSLDSTPIPWSAVHDAWIRHQTAEGLWKTLLTPAPGRTNREMPEDEDGEEKSGDEDADDVDEVVERLKRDPDLDTHEVRLLGSIVDTCE